MAVDNRPFKSKEQDGQGNEVIIRDQQLVEQGTTTTMASGACFETRDVDDRPVKIPRDNMMNIVLECIGIILNDSSRNLGTNVQKALGLQGNTVGHSTVADFASVLGGVAAGFTDANLLKSPGAYFIWTVEPAQANLPSFNGDHLVDVQRINNVIIQKDYCTQFDGAALVNQAVFYRYLHTPDTNNTWTAWMRTDNFGCNTPSALAELLGALTVTNNPFIDRYDDLDDFTTIGIYGCNLNPDASEVSHYPNSDSWKVGQLMVISGTYQSGGNQVTQIFFSRGETIGTYQRIKWSTIWEDWVRVDNFGCSTPSALAELLGAGGTKLASYFSGEYSVPNNTTWDFNVGFTGPALVFVRDANGSSDGNLFICGWRGHSYQIINNTITGLAAYFYEDGSGYIRVDNLTGANMTVYMSAVKL